MTIKAMAFALVMLIGFQGQSQCVSYAVRTVSVEKVKEIKKVSDPLPGWFECDEVMPPLDVLVRTCFNGDPDDAQKAILKQDGWYYPSGVGKLKYTPSHWQNL